MLYFIFVYYFFSKHVFLILSKCILVFFLVRMRKYFTILYIRVVSYDWSLHSANSKHHRIQKFEMNFFYEKKRFFFLLILYSFLFAWKNFFSVWADAAAVGVFVVVCNECRSEIAIYNRSANVYREGFWQMALNRGLHKCL